MTQTTEGTILWARAANWPSDAPAPDREEAAWIERARTGDESACRWLLDRYRLRAVRLAAHVLRRDSDAEDVAQEAFLRAFRRLATYQSSGRFSAWLFRIVVRLCLDRQRRAAWHRESALSVPETVPASASPTDTQVLVRALLDQLTPPMRAALVLREMEGLEYHEIAEALGIPVGTVRSRLNAARAQFRALWTAAQEETNHV